MSMNVKKGDAVKIIVFSQLSGDRSKDTSTPRLFLIVDNYSRIVVKSDMRAVGSSDTLMWHWRYGTCRRNKTAVQRKALESSRDHRES